MNQIKKIFLPTDFSPCSEEAAGYAFFLAERLNAAVLLAHVLEPVGYPVDLAIINAPEIERVKAKRALERTARLWKKKGIEIETALLLGDAAAQIVEKGEKSGSDLIVMGTHGRSGMAHLMMGSVAEKVVRRSPLPVLTVGRRKGKKSAGRPAAASKAKAAAKE